MKTTGYNNKLGIAAIAVSALMLATPALAQRGSGRSRGDSGSSSRTESSTETRTESRTTTRSSGQTPSRGSVQTPSRGSVQTPSRTNPQTPSRGPVQTPSASPWRGGSVSPTAPSVVSPRSTASGGRFGSGPVAPSGRADDRTYRSGDTPNSGRYGDGSSRGSATWNTGPVTPTIPTRPGGINGGAGSLNTGTTGRWNRPEGPATGNRPGGDTGNGAITPPLTRPGGIVNPGQTPARGGVTPTRPGTSAPPVLSWRTPGRAPLGGAPGQTTRPGGTSGQITRPGSTPGGESRLTQPPRGARYVSTNFKNRPPNVDRSRWLEPNRHFGGRDWNVVPLGYYDPWACYRTSSPWFVNVAFYYPYYYIGPYHAGFYYSPFHVYNGWFPTYIYPERVIYVERRVYLRDVVSDSNYYNPFDENLQSSLTSSMEDIKSAWLYGDGGRLLAHINAAVPVRVYQKGVYQYSLEPEDYRDVSKDALNRVDTVDFEWTSIDKKRSDEVVLTARHTFRDPDGDRHVIRLTYTLEKARGAWWITETGTSAWSGN